ncbi:MAG: GAF domain-containing protein, partial [Deltaproteobacteria bacterium]|nr:GAF domain-containing protein [Deltaproteobacteria bacterium]
MRQSCSLLLRRHKEEILEDWEATARTLHFSRELDHATLMDHIPEILSWVAEMADELLDHRAPHCAGGALELHAIERLDLGFRLEEVAIELGLLRNSIRRVWEHLPGLAHDPAIHTLDQALDLMMAATVECYSRARDRTQRVLEHIANAALESRSLDELLQRLLHILVGTSPSIHLAAIHVREGEYLHVRASVGLGDGTARSALRIGEGFAGTIAALRKPLELRAGATDPLVKRQVLRDSGVRALYGIPLIQDGEVIAVAHMGSLTQGEFSVDDKRMFRAMAARATEAVFQHMLRETAERTTEVLRERELEFRTLADNVPQLAWMADGNGAFYWYNKRWLDYAGTTLDEMRRSHPRQY